ncbi:DNA replication terminus site-binding protein [Dongshaea marina]|uniref:DNA replication terminus site-binding protein n=1 Tax=Dongshaea marina TaxID=2047966 RepID=UPI000D3E8FDB|nr:DNA replication terminus site-binding protein [Dongshaea marina]
MTSLAPEQTSHPVARLRTTLAKIQSCLGQLETLIRSQPVKCSVYQLPDVASGDEHEPIESIEVEPLEGEEALDTALHSFNHFFAREGCSTKATYRLPGYILLPAHCQSELFELIGQINSLKSAFKDEVLKAGDKNQRFELVHQAQPGAITLQIYRHLVLLDSPVQTLGFTWANKQSIRKVSQQQVLEILEKSQKTPPPLVDAEHWAQQVAREIQDIHRLSRAAQLRIRRPVKTHPMLNIRWLDREPRQQQVKAHSPLLLCQDKLPKIHPLGDFPPAKQRQRSDRQISSTPLIERIYLYEYLG